MEVSSVCVCVCVRARHIWSTLNSLVLITNMCRPLPARVLRNSLIKRSSLNLHGNTNMTFVNINIAIDAKSEPVTIRHVFILCPLEHLSHQIRNLWFVKTLLGYTSEIRITTTTQL